ncbi:MAG: HDOD domain-containing protein [Planctomycetes bacterium]|nr:HDOD domain-containing protein [Planctomycetota bacterium]NUQ35570.1 HDOD domain-containing protein [Planctomycetaceae bacterium]
MAVDPAKIENMLTNVEELPTLPSIIGRLIELLNDERSQAKQIAELISSDQALSAKVLKIVNSPLYGVSKKIGTISQAVVILGYSTVRSVVLSTSVIETFTRKDIHEGYFNASEFWTHAIGTAAASRAFARTYEVGRVDDAFTAGLLHGVGLLVLDQYLPDVMAQIQELVELEDLPLVEAEEEVMGMNHARVAARLLEEWKLPEIIVKAVANHIHVDNCPDDPQLASCVHLGDIFTRALGYGSAGEPTVPAINSAALMALGIDHTAFPVLIEPVDRDIQKASVLLEFARAGASA